MSLHTRRRAEFVTSLTATGMDEIRANESARLWEYEANRRGLDQAAATFWTEARVFVDELAERDRLTLAD